MDRLAVKREYLMSIKHDKLWNKFLICLADQIKYILALFVIALFYIILILIYTHGSLLFDGDNYGFYHLTTNLFTTPTGIFEGLSLFLSGQNVYIAFYIYTFFSIFIALLATYYFSSLLFKYFLPAEYRRIAAIVASFLYIINPSILVDYYSSFLGNISISNSFFILFLAFLFNAYEFHNIDQRKFISTISLGALFLGLSVTPFPNYIRTMFIGFVIFLTFLMFMVIRSLFIKSNIKLKSIVISIFFFVLISIAASLFISISFFESFDSTVKLANSAAVNFSGLADYTGAFNTIPQVIRLLGIWAFPTGYVIYHSIYYNINLVSVASYFWPLLALIVTLIIAFRYIKNRSFFLFLMGLVVCAIFWEKGGNLPFGFVWYFVNSILPFGYEFIPTGFLTGALLSKLYPVLSVLAIFLIFDNLKKFYGKGHHHSLRKIAVLAIPIFLAAMLVVAELPVFDGQLEENYFNPNSSGFFIPQDYSKARNYVLNHPGNVLILPGASAYMTFSWNYSGTTYFYNAFFNPVNVTTFENFGGEYGPAQQLAAFINITSPIIYSNGSALISSQWIGDIQAENYTYLIFDRSIVGGDLFENYSYTNAAIKILVDDHIIIPIYIGKILTLYKIRIANS